MSSVRRRMCKSLSTSIALIGKGVKRNRSHLYARLFTHNDPRFRAKHARTHANFYAHACEKANIPLRHELLRGTSNQISTTIIAGCLITFTSSPKFSCVWVPFDYRNLCFHQLSLFSYVYDRNGYEPEQCNSRETTYSHGENEQAARFDFGRPELENTKLRNELAKQERVMKSKRASKSRASSVEIPNDLKVKYILIF